MRYEPGTEVALLHKLPLLADQNIKTGKTRMKTIFALLMGLCMLNANASVMYEWQRVGTAPENLPTNMTLRITFSNAAIQSGSASYHLLDCINPLCAADPASPIEQLFFSVSGRTINYSPANPTILESMSVQVNFLADGYLAGKITANNTETDFTMASVDSLFTVIRVGSDAGFPGCQSIWMCSGATGFMRAVDATAIPEPSTISLAGLSLLLLGFCRRKRALNRQQPVFGQLWPVVRSATLLHGYNMFKSDHR